MRAGFLIFQLAHAVQQKLLSNRPNQLQMIRINRTYFCRKIAGKTFRMTDRIDGELSLLKLNNKLSIWLAVSHTALKRRS